LRHGREVLGEAETLLADGELSEALDERRLALAKARLGRAVGVAEFDLGNYGEALQLLPASVETLRRERALEEAAWTLSFLVQLHMALGLFEAAEAEIRAAVGLF